MDGLHFLNAGLVIQGSSDLTKDKQGLALAQKLVKHLEPVLAKHRFRPGKEDASGGLGLLPFQNESEALSIGGLTIENRMDRVSVYGELHISDDAAGYLAGSTLLRLASSIVSLLAADPNIPDSIQIVEPESVANPFFQGE